MGRTQGEPSSLSVKGEPGIAGFKGEQGPKGETVSICPSVLVFPPCCSGGEGGGPRAIPHPLPTGSQPRPSPGTPQAVPRGGHVTGLQLRLSFAFDLATVNSLTLRSLPPGPLLLSHDDPFWPPFPRAPARDNDQGHFSHMLVGARTGPGEGLSCFSFALVSRALQAPREPLVLLVKKAKEVPVESLVVLGPSAPLEKE